MCAAMSMVLLQDATGEETTGLEGAVSDTAQDAGQEISRLQDFFAGVYDYFFSTDFLANVIASALVILFGLFAYRVLTHGVPRVLRWRRRVGGPHKAPGHRHHPDPERPAVRDLYHRGAVHTEHLRPQPAARDGRRNDHRRGHRLRGAELPSRRDSRVLDHLRGPVQRRGLYRGAPARHLWHRGGAWAANDQDTV